MKLFLVLIAFISLTSAAYATERDGDFYGKVDEVFCGEVSPMAVGDACILLMTTEDQKKMGLVFDFDHWLSLYPVSGEAPESLIGKRVTAMLCDKVYSEDEMGVLKDFNAEYSYYNCYSNNVYVEQDEQ